jgi:signal transduction histidine kinase
LADRADIDNEWIGRLVRVLLVFRTLVLLVTLFSLHSAQRTPVVGLAVIVAAVISYVPLRHWQRVASSLAHHPTYLALEVLLATLILAAAGAHSPFFYFTLGTAVLAGVIYGRRGALPFSVLLMAAYEFVAIEGFPSLHPIHDAQTLVFAPLLYPAAVAAGVAAREMVERGVHTESLLRDRTEALASERERLRVARELHDSLAKTVEGLAMTASVLPGRCERDPAGAASLARELVGDAQQAALEARALMTDLRPGEDLSLAEAVRRRADSLAVRLGIDIRVSCNVSDETPSADKHELTRILGEAVINAARHGGAKRVAVTLEASGPAVRMSVTDDGCGLSGPVDLESLKADGHFGLAGMQERAANMGGTLSVGAAGDGGTSVVVRVPAAAEQDDRANRSSVGAESSGGLLARARRPLSAKIRT